MHLDKYLISKKYFTLIFFIFLLFSFLFRSSSFFQSVIDWDESLYLLMSRSLLDGYPPYVAIWEHKPPGIFVLFALAQLFFFKSILSIRIAACIAISITCYSLACIGSVISRNGKKVGLLAGILYAVFSCNNGGLASNTEIFFTPFVTSSFYLIFSLQNYPIINFKRNSLKLLATGLLMGVALQIKYVVVFDFIALLIIEGCRVYSQEHKNMKNLFYAILRNYLLLGIGPIIILFLVAMYFLLTGYFQEYVYANFIANKLYMADISFSTVKLVKALYHQVRINFLLWLCLSLAPLHLLFFKEIEQNQKNKFMLLLVWFFLAFLSVCFLKRFTLQHYFLQILPSLCIISSYIIINSIDVKILSDKTRQCFLLILILTGPIISNAYPYLESTGKFIYFRYLKGIDNWGDNSAAVAEYLQKRVSKEDYIYVVDYQPILYYLVNARIPTKYVMPLHMVTKSETRKTGINPILELEYIMRKKPVYIIRWQDQQEKMNSIPANDLLNPLFYIELSRHMQNRYEFETTIGEAKLYKLKN